jgi:hypothetical protein
VQRERERSKTLALYGVGGAALISLVAYMAFGPKEIPLDPRTLCPRESAHVQAQTTVILLDRTDPLTEIQQQDVITRLAEVLRAAAPHERFVIYPLDARQEIVLDAVVRCNPLGQKRSGALESVGTDEEFEQKRFKDKFLDPIVATVRDWLPSIKTTQADSPIMEMVQAVFVRDLRSAPSARLILVSDLMQHSVRYSQYTGTLDFKTFVRSDAFKEVAVDMRNTSVLILYITRTRGASRQPTNLESFWQSYFSALGVRHLVVQKVRGEGWQQ